MPGEGRPRSNPGLDPSSDTVGELESEWESMVGHQLPMLPPFQQFWDELTFLFEWLEGRREEAALLSIPTGRDEEVEWSPPPTISTWRSGVPLETVRFAASNRLLVELGYQGSLRVIEPYSLRRTRDGNLLLHAIRAVDREPRAIALTRSRACELQRPRCAPYMRSSFPRAAHSPPLRQFGGLRGSQLRVVRCRTRTGHTRCNILYARRRSNGRGETSA